MNNQFSRIEMLIGSEAMEILANARVAVFGVGGVGGYVVEALARSGVGTIDVIDNDTVCESNLNRQIIATRKTLGMNKTEAARDRVHDINPDCVVNVHNCFYLPETKDEFDFKQYSYVVDAVDTVAAKISIVMESQAAGVPVISSMGAGNKLDPTKFEVTDIYKTSVCPLAKVMRQELKKRNVKHLKVVYSKEIPLRPLFEEADSAGGAGGAGGGAEAIVGVGASVGAGKAGGSRRRSTPGSTAFVPSVVGLIIASEIVRELTAEAMTRARNGEN